MYREGVKRGLGLAPRQGEPYNRVGELEVALRDPGRSETCALPWAPMGEWEPMGEWKPEEGTVQRAPASPSWWGEQLQPGRGSQQRCGMCKWPRCCLRLFILTGYHITGLSDRTSF